FDMLYQVKLTKEEEAMYFGAAEHQKPKPSPDKAAPTAGTAPESAKTGGGAHILKATLNEISETNTQLFNMVVDDSYQSTPESKARLEAVKEQIGLNDDTKKHDDKNDQTPAAGRSKKAPAAKPASTTASTIGDDFRDIKGMSKSQIEELEALDEVHAAQRKAAAETDKATAGFSVVISDNIQADMQQEPEPSAPASRGSFSDRLKMKKTEITQQE
ncbi:hypothetical protein, partial [Erwinia sp. MYb416]|uniref:hypothetical protein n=1 Tax=Erwinia sp. MYb416 TaxID=3108532 RepID=UPI0030A88ED3